MIGSVELSGFKSCEIKATEEGLITTEEGLVTTEEGLITTEEGLITTEEGLITTEEGLITTEENKKSIFQKLLGTTTKKIIFTTIVVGCIVTAVGLLIDFGVGFGVDFGVDIEKPGCLAYGNEISAITGETPEIPTSDPDYPSLNSLCGYKLPESAMEQICAQRPFSLYENLKTEVISESDLKIKYVECVAAHTSTPCNNIPTFSTVTAPLPDNVIYAFAEQGRNSTLLIYYDAGFTTCVARLSANNIDTVQDTLLCSARRSDIEALPSNCPCVPDNTINPNDVPTVAPPTLPENIFESPSDSICGSRFILSSLDECVGYSLSDYNDMKNLSEAETKVIYEDCAFDHTDAACKRLPVFANVTITSDRVYRFEKLDAELSGLSAVYNTGFTQCVYINAVRFHNEGHISDAFFAELKTECLIDRAVAAAALSNCKCLPSLGRVTTCS